jgi:hypothetical protein
MTQEERALLAWLGQEEFSQYGECHGKHLDTLIAQGFVQVHDGRHGQSGFIAQGDSPMYRAVSLTDAGRSALTQSDT